MKTATVSALVDSVSQFLKRKVNLENFLISGELSNVKRVNGHVYFDLKDDKAQIACTLWKSYALRVPFEMKDGQAVLVHGALALYAKRGTLQLNCDSIELAGLGALYQELERRKKMLAEQGYFAPEHKKPMPGVIERIGIVTGKSTAALQDALKTIHTRWPMMEVHLFPASVQGEQAPATIVSALKKADAFGLDAILLIRGGGSFEDLFCFNDPEIVRTLYGMKTYTVTGIGHQIDTSLADLASDHHSLTPTAAAQWVTPDQKEVQAWIENARVLMTGSMKNLFQNSSQRLMYVLSNPYLASPESWMEARRQRFALLFASLQQQALSFDSLQSHQLERNSQLLQTGFSRILSQNQRSLQKAEQSLYMSSPRIALQKNQQNLDHLRERMTSRMENRMDASRQSLSSLSSMLSMVSWQNVLDRGFAIVLDQGKPVKDASSLQIGQEVQVEFAKGSALMRVEQTMDKQPIEQPDFNQQNTADSDESESTGSV